MDVISADLSGMVLDLLIYNAAASDRCVLRMGSTQHILCNINCHSVCGWVGGGGRMGDCSHTHTPL